MKKFEIGETVREGGPLGPEVIIEEKVDDIYVTKSKNGNAKGYLEAEYLYKIPKPRYKQLKLFEI